MSETLTAEPSITSAASIKYMNTNVSNITLTIEGMHCGACVRRVTQALERVPGTTVEEVRIGAARVHSEDSAPLIAALAKAGYPAHPEQL